MSGNKNGAPRVLEQWCLIANTIANTHLNHYERKRRIDVLRDMVALYKNVAGRYAVIERETWHQTLWNILFDCYQYPYNDCLTHSEVKARLYLFRDLCAEIGSSWDETWFVFKDDIPTPPPVPPVNVDDLPF